MVLEDNLIKISTIIHNQKIDLKSLIEENIDISDAKGVTLMKEAMKNIGDAEHSLENSLNFFREKWKKEM